MKQCMITFRSVTPAQRGERALKRAGLDCALQRTPRKVEEQGCGYCLMIACAHAPQAVGILQDGQIPFRKVYLYRKEGQLEEMQL